MPKISDERRAARHAQILDAAWTCFQRQGLHATTMDDIIRASGLSAGAVYSYFPSKEELIFAAVTTSLAGLRDRVDALLDRPILPAPGALVREIALEVARFADRDDYDLRRVALLGWAETQRSERLRGVMRDAYLAFRGRLAATAESWTELVRFRSAPSPKPWRSCCWRRSWASSSSRRSLATSIRPIWNTA